MGGNPCEIKVGNRFCLVRFCLVCFCFYLSPIKSVQKSFDRGEDNFFMLPDIIFEWLIMYLYLCMHTFVILEAKLIFQAKK